jgi:hypothetical protein
METYEGKKSMERCNFLLREAPGRGRKLAAHLGNTSHCGTGKEATEKEKFFHDGIHRRGKSRSNYCEEPVT